MRMRTIGLGIVLCSIGCVARISAYRALEIKQGTSLEERLAFAKTFASPPRLDWLRKQLAERFSSLTAAELAGVYLTVQTVRDVPAATHSSGVKVYLVVGVQGGPRDVDRGRVLEAAAQELQRALALESTHSAGSGPAATR